MLDRQNPDKLEEVGENSVQTSAFLQNCSNFSQVWGVASPGNPILVIFNINSMGIRIFE